MIYKTNKIAKDISCLNNLRGRFSNNVCFILGNSPSLNNFDLNLLNGFFTIGINRSILAYDSTMLFWQDYDVYIDIRGQLGASRAILYSREGSDPQNVAYHFRVLQGNKITDNFKFLYRLGNIALSGPLAIQAANIFGFHKIFTLGCDCQYDGDKTDFYGVNKKHNENTLDNCRKGMKVVEDFFGAEKIISLKSNEHLYNTIESLSTLKDKHLEDLL